MPDNLTSNVISGIIANFLTAVLFFILTWTVYLFFIIRERKRLLRFLGVNHKFPNLKILLSRVEVKPGGTIPVEGETIHHGYVGPAISKPEYDAALILYRRINPRWLASIPNRVRDLLSRRYISLIRLEPMIDVSPKNIDEIPKRTNLILVGSSVYNGATKLYLDQSKESFEFSSKDKLSEGGKFERVIKLRKYGMEGVEIPGRSRKRELGIIQRVSNKEDGNTVLISAGLGAEATFGCTKYLAENMADLESKYRQKEFGICLAFEKQGDDIINSSPPRVIEEIIFDS